MENMQYAEELVREFLVFRGFTSTLQAFEAELNTDIGKGFQVDKLSDLIFSVYVPKFQAEKLVGLLTFFRQCLCSTSETVLMEMLSNLEISILRYYLIYAMQSGRQEKVVEFFAMCGSDLIHSGHDWAPWFSIPYVKNPSLEPSFRIYFSKEWLEALRLSVRNFFSEVFNCTRVPALLKISSEKDTINRLKKDIKQLNLKLTQLQALLEAKEAELCQLRSKTCAKLNSNPGQVNSSSISTNMHEDNLELLANSQEAHAHESLSEMTSGSALETSTSSRLKAINDVMEVDKGENEWEDELPEVKVDFQETFLGHTTPITRCRFSASGNNIASASMDGTVRIWTYDSSTPASRNATIYCGAEIMSLEWDCKSDRLLLIGAADGGIKAWNVDAKRVVCDLNTSKAFPSVLDLKCSPVEPIFVSAAASRRTGTTYVDSLGFASLTVWNMKTWKAMTVLPLGEDAPAITSLCFNHNGKILAASATDGMIHMFDMSAGLQITGWPAHDSAITSILFGSDETSIFSLGSDGKIFEWSLHNQGQVLWSKDWSRFLESPNIGHHRHEMALDANGRRLLVTSASVRAPIYQVGSYTNGFKTLPHSAAITTVDWHPTSPIFLTGSVDNSVRVTSIV